MLFLMRGVPGSGKSSFLKEHIKVPGFVISPDEIRLMFSPVVLQKKSMKRQINQENDKEVFDFLHRVVVERLKQGYTTVVDATHCSASGIDYYKSFAQHFNVKCFVVEFNDYENEAEFLNLCKERDASREEFRQVGGEVIERMYKNAKTQPVPKWASVISKEEFAAMCEQSAECRVRSECGV